jgi:hypothetical protein
MESSIQKRNRGEDQYGIPVKMEVPHGQVRHNRFARNITEGKTLFMGKKNKEGKQYQ